MLKQENITLLRVVELIVYNPDWKEKVNILDRYIKKLSEAERLEQIKQQLDHFEIE